MSQPVTAFAPAAVRCPHCGHEVRYYDARQSTFFGCPECHTFFTHNEIRALQKIRRFKEYPNHIRPLALGSTGRLAGETYRVTGYQWRCEAKSPDYRWEEFQLRHETTGASRQLAVFEGHWLLIEPTDEEFKPNKEQSIPTLKQQFELYNRYKPRVLYAEGEFDWNVLADESLTISEYIAPPQMLVRERNKYDEWYRARHLEPAEVAAAFGLEPGQLPYRQGVGAAQPAPGGAAWPLLSTVALLMALLVVLTHVFLMKWGNETVFNQEFVSFAPPPTTPGAAAPERPMLVSPSFAVPGTGALTVDLQAGVDNSWVEIPYALVNEQTGQQFAATTNLEHYSGVEDGESWQEGDREANTLLNQVPAGQYHLNFYPLADPGKAEQVQFRATVRARATAGSNAFLALLLLLLYPGYSYLRRSSHEHTRWQNSDFGP
ncbi:DUF4178 domain-containing protein [Hymenobacter psychrophilus]|uniref:DUF4178 domain-containing protein n=1 Tax=Hymenobacter psychrophilus TaxID=651662 RepID=A0A1H3GN08_9BACT|nr:DUF4178 domain-containing protein [Hymenobacter psychrophilus]SDY04507.1 protein of unknown function [Hymenobacter psychrophilus]